MSEASAHLQGVGVHSGVTTRVTLHRVDGAVRFLRSGVTLTPHVRHVVDTRGATTLAQDSVRIGMVEHLLAALHVRGIWEGLLIEVDGEELPILDGSAAPWDEALATLDPFPDAPPPRSWRGRIEDADGRMASLEAGARQLDVSIAFDHPHVGTQRWTGGPEAWADLLAARTFGFARDAEALRAAGFARGASDTNAIVFGDDVLPILRFPDEPVRHKALDALGDAYLLGQPFDGRLRVERGGHDLHVRLARHVLDLAGEGLSA